MILYKKRKKDITMITINVKTILQPIQKQIKITILNGLLNQNIFIVEKKFKARRNDDNSICVLTDFHLTWHKEDDLKKGEGCHTIDFVHHHILTLSKVLKIPKKINVDHIKENESIFHNVHNNINSNIEKNLNLYYTIS